MSLSTAGLKSCLLLTHNQTYFITEVKEKDDSDYLILLFIMVLYVTTGTQDTFNELGS